MTKKNIVMVLVDDLGWKDVGGDFYETPVLDEIAKNGMVFDEAYSTCPVCSPSRASILTGKYPASLDLTDWIDNSGKIHPLEGYLIDAPYIKHLPRREDNLAKILKRNGWRTYHVGKWHLGGTPYHPDQQGFDVNIAGCCLGHPPNGYFSPYRIENLEDGPQGEYLTDRLTDEAIGLIKNNGDAPFLLDLWHYAVHMPEGAIESDVEYFRKKAAAMGLDRIDPFLDGEEFHTLDKRGMHVRRRLLRSDPVYAAMILSVDRNLGRLIEALEETGKKEDTIIFFTSDNGGLSTAECSPTSNLPASEGKGWVYEGGVRVPLILYGSGIPKGKVSSFPVTGADLLPTILDMLGLEAPDTDGTSFLPTIQGNEQEERAIFWHYPHYGNQGGTPASAVRKGRWKLIEFFEDWRTELYDLEADIGEKNDLSSQYPEIASELSRQLASWRKSIGARIPERNPKVDHPL